MAYGRLDVFWPDGTFETYTLDAPNVSVGRSPGNTIALETDTISRYHFSILDENGDIVLKDMESANGTFVDGVRLEHNKPFNLRGGEEIQIGHLRMIYHVMDESPTIEMDALVEDTQRFEQETVPFRIDLQSPALSVTPGAYRAVEVTINNPTTETKQFMVLVDGLPEGWARVNRPRLEVEAEDYETVLVNVKPIRHSSATPGVYAATVTVAYKHTPEVRLEAPIQVTVLPFTGFGMALATPRITSDVPFQLFLHNQGSAPLPVQITPRDRGNHGLNFVLATTQFTLSPGQRVQVQGRVRGGRRLVGDTRTVNYDLIAHSLDPARFTAAVSGQYTDQALLPNWAGAGVAVGAFAVILLLFAMLAGVFAPPPQPQLDTITINAGRSQVAQGEPLVINWAVSDTQEVVAEVNGRIAERLTLTTGGVPTAGDITLDTAELSGDITVKVTAINGDQQDSVTESLIVYQPAIIQGVSVEPTQLYRHVVQTLTISWETSGAVDLDVTGLTEMGDLSFDPPPPDATSVQAIGIPQRDGAVTLTVYDEVGNATQRQIDIILSTPSCLVSGEAALHPLPDATTEPIRVLGNGVTVTVNGRDTDALWLRFDNPSGEPFWGLREAFICNGFDVASLRAIVPDVPPTAIAPPLTPVEPPATGTPEDNVDAPVIAPSATPGGGGAPPLFTPTPTAGG